VHPLLSLARDLPRSYEDLLSLADVDELVSRRGLRTPFLRMAKDGQVVAPARFTAPGGAGAEIADQASDERVLRLFADGSTLVLQGLHRVWPALQDFAGQLAADLGHPTQVNAYLTPPQSRGFDPHYDVHDVFVLQVAGEKRWLVHEPVLEAPLRSQEWTDRRAAVAAGARHEPVLDTVLRPGDALYLPRGWLHSARALGDTSMHLTVGVHPVTRYAVVESLLSLAAGEPALRTSLPLGVEVGHPQDVEPELVATVKALQEWLPTVDATEVAAALRASTWPMTRPAPLAPLAQAAFARALTTESAVRLRERLQLVLGEAGDQVVVQLADRRIALPVAAAPALEVLVAGGPVAVGDLPGLEPEERLVLVRRLLREGVLVPASE